MLGISFAGTVLHWDESFEAFLRERKRLWEENKARAIQVHSAGQDPQRRPSGCIQHTHNLESPNVPETRPGVEPSARRNVVPNPHLSRNPRPLGGEEVRTSAGLLSLWGVPPCGFKPRPRRQTLIHSIKFMRILMHIC